MSSTPLQIEPIFASPIAVTYLQDCEVLNRELESLFLEREKQGEKFRNPYPSHLPHQALFESDFDLFSWPETCVQRLRHFMMENLGRVIAQLNGYTPADMARLGVFSHTWFHITRFGGYFTAHNHAMASWSMVYCVHPGEQVADQPESGVLRFLDLRPSANMYMDPANSHLKRPFNAGSINFKLRPGQLVIFPSYLVHEVVTFFGRDVRITVASNCWVREK